jgi:flagellar biosynthetic protein FliP
MIRVVSSLLGALVVLALSPEAVAQALPAPESALSLTLSSGDGELVPALKVAFLLMGLSLLPAMLVSVTSFTRIVIVLGFIRQALGTQSSPPNQVIVGLSLFLCLFTMGPVFADIHEQAIEPYQAGQLNDSEALEAAIVPLRSFMARHTRPEDLALFVSMVQDEKPTRFEDVGTTVLVPAFMLSELRTAFLMGALILIPFLIIDMVVASVLMAMGMMMVPPIMVSLPIKLLLFVLADGWNLVVSSVARSVMGG